MIVPEDREKTLEAFRRVPGGGAVLHSFRILRGDGQIRWIRNTGFPLVDAESRVQRIGGIAHDATEEVEMQDRLQVLVAEIQHRSRNLVGVVQAVTERTLATSETLEEFRARFRIIVPVSTTLVVAFSSHGDPHDRCRVHLGPAGLASPPRRGRLHDSPGIRSRIAGTGVEVLGPVPDIQGALDLLEAGPAPDGAMVYPLAEILQERNIPFVFATGYEAWSIPERYRNLPRREKPLNMR